MDKTALKAFINEETFDRAPLSEVNSKMLHGLLHRKAVAERTPEAEPAAAAEVDAEVAMTVDAAKMLVDDKALLLLNAH